VVIILLTRPPRRIIVTYLRCTIGRWNIDLNSDDGREAFHLIESEGLQVFRAQPGFIRYRLMVADPTSTSGSWPSVAEKRTFKAS
jgi:hypothetical protein